MMAFSDGLGSPRAFLTTGHVPLMTVSGDCEIGQFYITTASCTSWIHPLSCDDEELSYAPSMHGRHAEAPRPRERERNKNEPKRIPEHVNRF